MYLDGCYFISCYQPVILERSVRTIDTFRYICVYLLYVYIYIYGENWPWCLFSNFMPHYIWRRHLVMWALILPCRRWTPVSWVYSHGQQILLQQTVPRYSRCRDQEQCKFWRPSEVSLLPFQMNCIGNKATSSLLCTLLFVVATV